MRTFDEYLNENLQDDEFRKEFEKIKPEMDAIREYYVLKEGDKNVVLTEFEQEKYDKMRREEGREEGIEKGIILNLCNLVAKKRLTLKEALEECNLSKAEFQAKMKEYGLEMSKV